MIQKVGFLDKKFQFLMVRLKELVSIIALLIAIIFQFLMVRLKAMVHLIVRIY